LSDCRGIAAATRGRITNGANRVLSFACRQRSRVAARGSTPEM
jgi:hypothetical protein